MKLSAKTDLEAPIRYVYAMLSDFVAWEREAVRRGAEVERPADSPLSGVGAVWRVRANYRGKPRKVVIRLVDLQQDERLGFSLDSPSVEGTSQIELIVLSPRRTRMRLTVEVRPKTLAARLFINTLRLAKRRVDTRFDKRVSQLASRIEGQYQRSRAQGETV